jgi:hypothetical protein
LTRRQHRVCFFHRTVDVGRDGQPVPVDDVFEVRVVGDVDRNARTLANADHRSGYAVVVGERADDVAGCDLESRGSDDELVVGAGLLLRERGECNGAGRGDRSRTGDAQKRAAF